MVISVTEILHVSALISVHLQGDNTNISLKLAALQ